MLIIILLKIVFFLLLAFCAAVPLFIYIIEIRDIIKDKKAPTSRIWGTVPIALFCCVLIVLCIFKLTEI